MLKKPKFELRKLTELHGEGSSVEELLGMRHVLTLNKLMDMSYQSKNLFKIQNFNGVKEKILEMGFGHYEEEESCWEKQKSEKRDRPQNRSRSRSRERDGHYSNSHKSKYHTDPYERDRSKKRDRSRSPKKSKDKEKSKYR
ncbi:hypothetical protein MC885_002346 [Smutsia gigantea]|nr:hypothetical protein MC885_002346 [Smutsia gigantea]